jgi:hypothetical protein
MLHCLPWLGFGANHALPEWQGAIVHLLCSAFGQSAGASQAYAGAFVLDVRLADEPVTGRLGKIHRKEIA